ncbi:hypothetical protein MNB_SV-5-1135 [hydrothermal vent metagenome]|uniref:CopG family transcriptional regulator n=1 Tax=hydrothermal vent metagenome TaxID=652676 RepID=A0A1W1EB99_9ZZZZ
MDESIKIELKQSTVDNLHVFSDILKKDINSMLEEALDEYFVSVQKKLLEKNINDENALTNLDYNEFWDDLDIEE